MMFASTAFGHECRIKGTLQSKKAIETSFESGDLEKCKELALMTSSNSFFGLIEAEDKLIETTFQFKENEKTVHQALESENQDS